MAKKKLSKNWLKILFDVDSGTLTVYMKDGRSYESKDLFETYIECKKINKG